LLSRIFGIDREKLRELELRVSYLEGQLRESAAREEQIAKRIEVLERRIQNVEVAEAKLAQGLLELVKTLEQEGGESARPQRAEARRASSAELEKEILSILRDSGPATARTIADRLGKTREHLSRALKSMAASGRIIRQVSGKEFVYSIPAET